MGESVLGMLKRKYGQEQDYIKETMANGVKDWPEYQRLVGRYAALDLAIGELEKVERTLMEGDFDE